MFDRTHELMPPQLEINAQNILINGFHRVESMKRKPITFQNIIYELIYGIKASNYGIERYLSTQEIIIIACTLYEKEFPELIIDLSFIDIYENDDMVITDNNRIHAFDSLHEKHSKGKNEKYGLILRYLLSVWYQKGSWRSFKRLLDNSTSKRLIAAHMLYGAAIDFKWNPEWRTNNVIALRERIFENGEYDKMPILADALEEAGCDNLIMLNHLRTCRFFSKADSIFK